MRVAPSTPKRLQAARKHPAPPGPGPPRVPPPAVREPTRSGRAAVWMGALRLGRQLRGGVRGAIRLFFTFSLALMAPLQAAPFEAADREVERLMKSGGVPGAALIVVKDGAVVHARAFGVSSAETGVPVTTRTLFPPGFHNQLLVALAALRLVDNGKLRLNQPVGDLLPELDLSLRRVTLEQLLTRTTRACGRRADQRLSGRDGAPGPRIGVEARRALC